MLLSLAVIFIIIAFESMDPMGKRNRGSLATEVPECHIRYAFHNVDSRLRSPRRGRIRAAGSRTRSILNKSHKTQRSPSRSRLDFVFLVRGTSTLNERRKYRAVALGGTFDVVHKGHQTLLNRAFEVSDTVLIGLVGDELSRDLAKKHTILSFTARRRNLETFLQENGWRDRAVVRRLDDRFGSTISDRDIEAIIVTPETRETAVEINRIRKSRGFKPLDIETVGFVLADDGLPISTTRIRNGEIDSQGRRLRVGTTE